jgi:hypothetical protein
MVRTVEEALALRAVWARFEVGHRMASTSAIRHPRTLPSISGGGQSSSGRMLYTGDRRGKSGRTALRFRWSTRMPPVGPRFRDHPIRSSGWRWATMASTEPTKTNCAPSTCEIGLKADRVIKTPFRRLILAGSEVGRFHGPARPSALERCRHRARHRSLRLRRQGPFRRWSTGREHRDVRPDAESGEPALRLFTGNQFCLIASWATARRSRSDRPEL